MTAGLYQVVDGVFQVRGLDLANMNIVQVPGGNGIVIIDCLTSVETARRALEVYQGYHRGLFGQDADIKALVYTHCHADHFGGAQAIVDKAGADLVVIGPDGFLEHAVSENIYAGAAMTRRSVYMYGERLDKSPTGQIGAGLGQALSAGVNSLVAPTQIIKRDGPLEPAINGLDIVCQLTPGTEAPAEVNFYFPQYKALCMAENATHTLHNIQTLRGAPVRDARLWSRYLDESIALFGTASEVVFSSHHWPTWKQADGDDDGDLVVRFLSEQRDYYAYLHNETLRQLNNGQTPLEIAESIQMPPSLSTRTNLQGYYGSVSHNVKGVYDRYMGWFDGNPANLWRHTPVGEATRYVAAMGGRDAVLAKAADYQADADLRFAATLLNHLVFSDSKDDDAKQQLGSIYTKLGQGAENGTWRNIYLAGARELLYGAEAGNLTMSPDSLMAVNLDELFDTLAIRIEGPRAVLEKGVTIEFMVEAMRTGLLGASKPAGWHLRLSNGALTGRAVKYVAPPKPRDGTVDLTVWLNHEALVKVVGSAAAGQPITLDSLGLVTSGDEAAWDTITALIVLPNPAFNIVTP
ncbi:beta-lactamase domain-containing protein [Purpureocillium lavendulum]|uniref:Beta-lactamase domain-containing protein n=1 Tax=Purpureocillium lavendulum TaxID=1247861 RepID=A0AB34FGJ5_9HYPO|nr:beta-lactamase domain-containing protein [Purpureocillium lavendulum]